MIVILLILLLINFCLSQDNHHRNRYPAIFDIETRIDNEILSNMKYLCPVSSSFDTEFDSIHGYPIDIFDMKLHHSIINSNNQLIKDEYFFNCSGYEKNSTIHHCSTLTTCPITKQNIIDATSRQRSWETFHSFCSIRETFREPSAVINLIILGGSVTGSSGTFGCCCVKSIDEKCFDYGKYAQSFSFREQASYCGSSAHEQYGDMAKECSWSSFFYKWLNHKSKMAKINFINLAESGATSQYKAERVIDQLKKNGISQLTGNDIILIDHSVNDANSYNIHNNGNKFTHDQWIIGIETLIRRLLYFSKSEDWPSIVILEQFPFNSERTPQDSNYNSNAPSYSDAYTRVATKYKIPIWSYRDVVWKMNESFSTYLRFEQIPYEGIHPPWFVHLFYADLIAAIFVLTFHECLIETVSNKNKLSPHIRPRNQQYYQQLPPQHTSINTSYCDDNPPYLDISAEMITYNRTTEMIGSYTKNGSWILNEDRIGKSGFISSFFNSSYDVSILTFSMYNYTLLLDGHKPSLVKIHYMRTYKDAGIVEVYLCDNLIGYLDTLWRDHEHFHYTFNDIFTFDYIAGHSNFCLRHTPPKIILIHRYYDSKNTDFGIDDQVELGKLMRKEHEARLYQKVKIKSITICKKQI